MKDEVVATGAGNHFRRRHFSAGPTGAGDHSSGRHPGAGPTNDTVIIPPIVIPVIKPLAVLAIPTIGVTIRLLPLPVLAVRAIGVGVGPGLGKSLTIRLQGKRPIRSSLGAQGAQRHKQTHRENNAPPSFSSHLIILLKINRHSGFVNLECRPSEEVNE